MKPSNRASSPAVKSFTMSTEATVLSLARPDVDQLADDFEKIVGIVSPVSIASTHSSVIEDLQDQIEAVEADIATSKAKLSKLKLSLRKQLKVVNSPTTHENASLAVVIRNQYGEFNRQIHNNRDGTLYYYTDGDHKTLLTLSATKVSTAEVRAAGGEVVDGKKGAAVHFKDLSSA